MLAVSALPVSAGRWRLTGACKALLGGFIRTFLGTSTVIRVQRVLLQKYLVLLAKILGYFYGYQGTVGTSAEVAATSGLQTPLPGYTPRRRGGHGAAAAAKCGRLGGRLTGTSGYSARSFASGAGRPSPSGQKYPEVPALGLRPRAGTSGYF